MSEHLTDSEWREFQNMPEEGVSHRGWVDAKIAGRVARARAEERERLRCHCCQGRCSCGGSRLGPDKRGAAS